MSGANYKSVGEAFVEWEQLSIIAGFLALITFSWEAYKSSLCCVSFCVCVCVTVLKADMTYICSPSCYGWAGTQVDTHRRCHLSVFPCRCVHSRDSCPCRWGPPSSLRLALRRKWRADLLNWHIYWACLLWSHSGKHMGYHRWTRVKVLKCLTRILTSSHMCASRWWVTCPVPLHKNPDRLSEHAY